MQAIPVHFQLKAMPKACQVLLKSGSNAQRGKAGHLISYRGRDKRRDKGGVSCYLVHFNFPISFQVDILFLFTILLLSKTLQATQFCKTSELS
jgi:hypothetical protein